ncbi:MAG: matrixin family metalloprotease [Deltaproteobacteria bacterium]|nr:matrixin family metalloprotease [Deltaproteobacteria bacterium]
MNRSALFALALGAAFTFGAPQAQAWECLTGSCPKWCNFPVPYGLTIASPDLGDATTVSELQRGFADWTLVSCTDLTASYTGRSGGTAGNGDGQSLVGWVESGWSHGSGAIGVTGPRWNGRNCIVEADMEMNGVNFTWITGSGRGSNVNAYSIILHEAGHYYGLGHSDLSSATMYFAYQGGIDALGTDDQNGICTLYPGEGGGPVDCTTTGCPSGQVCESGVCMAETGDGTLCAPCTDSGQCGGSGDFCLSYPDGRGYCGTSCSSSGECGAGGQCVSTTAGGQCIRIQGGQPSCEGAGPSGCTSNADCTADQMCNTSTGECVARPTGGIDNGQPCTDSAECNSGLCASTSIGQVCTEGCNDLSPASCSPGFYCERGGLCGDGFCVPGTAGPAADGASCAVDTDCASLLCDRGTCGTPCQVGGATVCGAGFTCQGSGTTACGACKPEGSVGGLGDPCLTRDECATEECALRDGAGFCTNYCDDTDPCPTDFTCVVVTDALSVCSPNDDGGRDDGGCGCSVPGASASNRPLWLFLIVVPAIVFWRRRRRSRCG